MVEVSRCFIFIFYISLIWTLFAIHILLVVIDQNVFNVLNHIVHNCREWNEVKQIWPMTINKLNFLGGGWGGGTPKA